VINEQLASTLHTVIIRSPVGLIFNGYFRFLKRTTVDNYSRVSPAKCPSYEPNDRIKAV